MAGTPLGYQDNAHKHAATHRNGSQAFTYDNNGNMVTRIEGSTTYTQLFDVENRLKTVSLSSSTIVTHFAYDASGQRLRTDVAPTSPSSGNTRTITTYPFPGYEVEQRYTWQYVCASEENCYWAWAQTATITRKTYFLGGQAIATHISGDPSSGNNGFFYLHSDHLGSSSLLTNSSGVKVTGSETRYYPYGAQRLAPTMPADNITDRDFTGQKENSYIKLIYYNARWYDSQIGRFVSADTIVPQTDNPQAYNRYTYVYNNPLNLVDPSGHCAGNPDEYANSDRACWILLLELERTWGMDIQDEALWELEHLQQLTMIMHGYSDLVGGDDIWKGVLSESASRAGNDKFLVRGTLPAHCPTAKTGCSKSGEVSFDLAETFLSGRGAAGTLAPNAPGSPTAARVTIAHEFSHIITNLLGDEYYSDYMDLRDWHFAPMPNNGGRWLAANHADPIYGWPENPKHHLVHATALYVAGGNTWDLVSTPDKMVKGPIPPKERIFIEGMGNYLP